jgi:drug/metabolite transporter (DMT)-like permease
MSLTMAIPKPSRPMALIEGVLVTLIWASSFVLVKQGLAYMGPLTIAGLRYFLAFLLLLPLMVQRGSLKREYSPSMWLRLLLLGISAYTLGNGAMFWALKTLPATTGSFIMSLMPILVIGLGIVWLREFPTGAQVVGMLVGIFGSLLFFSPGGETGDMGGFFLALVALLAFTLFGTLGREVARAQSVGVLALTALPLALGGGLALLIALWVEGVPRMPPMAWAIVLWLAVVNTALAYVLYNHSLQELTALEMTVLLNLSPFVTALLAWWFLGERLSGLQLLGMAIVIAGVTLVQITAPAARKEKP